MEFILSSADHTNIVQFVYTYSEWNDKIPKPHPKMLCALLSSSDKRVNKIIFDLGKVTRYHTYFSPSA